MGINFSSMNSTPVAPEATPAPMVEATPVAPIPAPASTGMSLDLSKNMTLDITKRNPGLKRLVVGAGWDTAAAGADIDLDIISNAFNVNESKIKKEIKNIDNIKNPKSDKSKRFLELIKK